LLVRKQALLRGLQANHSMRCEKYCNECQQALHEEALHPIDSVSGLLPEKKTTSFRFPKTFLHFRVRVSGNTFPVKHLFGQVYQIRFNLLG